MKKILIADDSVYNLTSVYDFLFKYDVTLYPTENEIVPFSDLLFDFGSGQIDDGLERIVRKIEEFDPDIILLDVCLNDSVASNTSGYDIQKAIEDHSTLRSKEVFHLTRHQPRFFGNNRHIPKGSSMEGFLKAKIVEPFGLKRKVAEEPGIQDRMVKRLESQERNDSIQQIIDRIKRDQGDPFKSLADSVDNAYTNKLKVYGDAIITTLFYITLPALFLAGVALIIKGAIKSEYNPIHIAEYAFISFLPFLMVFGFFTFYALSLRHYLRAEQVNEDSLDLASRLLMMTKTLFISSLISYVFTKLIEISELADEYQIAALFGIVVALTLYYFYLNSHKKSH
ncbi:hypothetical protein [Dyadobacter sp. BHUBP1]|uniref:hypothetical protein n=1 Tax=Dyadobacter sp. BHUBP1 TaxID=3424178 RepID=UPI003D34187A